MDYMDGWRYLNITNQEEKVYKTLLKNGASTVSKLAQLTHLDQRSVYDYIERLINKGLVGQIIQNGKRTFLSLNPHMLSFLIEEEKKDVENEFENLNQIFSENKRPIHMNYITTKQSFLKIIKNINSKTTLYFGQGIKKLQNEPYFQFFEKNIRPQKIKISNNAKIVAIFYDNVFLIYSIPEEKGFFIDDNDYTKNMKVYFK